MEEGCSVETEENMLEKVDMEEGCVETEESCRQSRHGRRLCRD